MRWIDLSLGSDISKRYELKRDDGELLAILIFNNRTKWGIYRLARDNFRSRVSGGERIDFMLANPEVWYMEAQL